MGLFRRKKDLDASTASVVEARPKRTKAQWRQLICFYLWFYCFLVGLFAICYVAMYNLIPPIADGPQLRDLVQQGVSLTPSDSAFDVSDAENFQDELDDALESAQEFFEDGRFSNLSLTRIAETHPNCSTFQGLRDSFENYTPCIIASMNRVFGFTPASDTVVPKIVLEFPETKEEFFNRYGVEFDSIASVSGNFTTEEIGYPFRGDKSAFNSPAAALQIDLREVRDKILSGETSSGDFSIIVGIEFDYGQETIDEDNGRRTERLSYNGIRNTE